MTDLEKVLTYIAAYCGAYRKHLDRARTNDADSYCRGAIEALEALKARIEEEFLPPSNVIDLKAALERMLDQ